MSASLTATVDARGTFMLDSAAKAADAAASAPPPALPRTLRSAPATALAAAAMLVRLLRARSRSALEPVLFLRVRSSAPSLSPGYVLSLPAEDPAKDDAATKPSPMPRRDKPLLSLTMPMGCISAVRFAGSVTGNEATLATIGPLSLRLPVGEGGLQSAPRVEVLDMRGSLCVP